MSWRPAWWRRRTEPRLEVVKREQSRLTVAEWRSDLGWVGTAATVLGDARLRLMLDCVANSAPGLEVLPLDASPQARIAQQARGEGYTMALANLEALGKASTPAEPLEALFEEPQRGEHAP